jgi:hypothetical protein
MITYISKCDIISILGARYSRAGAEAFADFLEEKEEKAQRLLFFNPTEIFAEYLQYETASKAAQSLGWKPTSGEYDYANEAGAMFFLTMRDIETVEFKGGVIIRDPQI